MRAESKQSVSKSVENERNSLKMLLEKAKNVISTK